MGEASFLGSRGHGVCFDQQSGCSVGLFEGFLSEEAREGLMRDRRSFKTHSGRRSFWSKVNPEALRSVVRQISKPDALKSQVPLPES